MNDLLKQAIAAAVGALLAILVMAIAGWVSRGGIIELLDARTQGQLDDLRAALEALSAKKPEAADLLAKTIILTDQECAVLGEGWRLHEGLAGRFALGAGSHADPRGETQTFAIGDDSRGTYSHQLTVPEMPKHTHSFVGSRGSRSVDDWDNEWGHREHSRRTASEGGDEAHNNMPPYFVLNFCHRAGA
ncbi:MAG: hypothetical protein OXP66_05525 [Candidatus Tectomicrobia bacterium]|nr:hypothetical protein [Candidatus Tectomicrobia bacterium]